MSPSSHSSRFQNTPTWPDLPGYVADLAPVMVNVDQLTIRHKRRVRVTLNLFRHPHIHFVEFRFRGKPNDAVYLAVGRSIWWYKCVCEKGGQS